MIVRLNNTLVFFIKIAILLTPLNALPYFTNIFRQFSVEGSFYPFLIAVFFFIYYLTITKKIYLPQENSFYLLVIFLVWVFLSGMVNILDIITANTQGRNGFEKFFLQTLILFFMFYVIIYIFNIFRTLKRKENILIILRRYVLFSFLLTGFYSFFEIMNIFSISFGSDFINIVDPLLRHQGASRTILRISSLSSEPSTFAMYLAFAFPWVLSYVITQRKRKIYALLNIYLIFLLILTFSRTAYVIFLIQILLFGYLFFREIFNRRNINFILYSLLFTLICMMLIEIFMEREGIFYDRTYWFVLESLFFDSGRNVGRYSAQISAFNMFLDNPIFGIGLGQYIFHLPEYIPTWAYAHGSSEVQSWANSSSGSASVTNLYIRLLAETGIFGLILWAGIWILVIYELLHIIKIYPNINLVLLKTLIISMIGSLLAGFNYDVLCFWESWILLGIFWSYKETNIN